MVSFLGSVHNVALVTLFLSALWVLEAGDLLSNAVNFTLYHQKFRAHVYSRIVEYETRIMSFGLVLK